MASAGRARYRVTDRRAPRKAVDPDIARRADRLRDDTVAGTPRLTGRLASSWHVERTGDADYRVTTDVEYARYVEFGTRDTRAAAMVGRALARARSR